jgi:hypothetical protein
MGNSVSDGKALALVEINGLVTQQANFLSSLDGFYYIIVIALVASVIAAWQKRID